MNDILKAKLEIIANDELMLKAIKELFDAEIVNISPDIDKTNDNKILGEKFRAVKEAERLVKFVLQDISSHKKQRSGDNKLDKSK